MRFLTKEWYQAMQSTALHVMLEIDLRAGTFSEKYFRELYNARLQKWFDIRAKLCNALEMPFDKDAERKSFAKGYRTNKKIIVERIPDEILRQVADIRVLALNCCTEEVKCLITSFSEANHKFIEETMSAYKSFAHSQFSDADDVLLKRFHFHDEEVKSSRRIGNDWVIDFGECSEGYSQIRYVRFKNASVLKQEKRLYGAWWLYEELYKTQSGYEVHVLLDKNGLIEFILSCDDVVLE